MSWQDYLAVGFPLVTAAVLAAFFPISLKNYFVPGEIQKLEHGLTPYRIRARDYLHIFILYTLSAVFLSVLQGYLLWNFARDPALRFSSRYTDFFLYPVFPSALMAVLLMLFVFSYIYVSRGEDDVRKFLLRTYDGWPLYREIPRFKPVALAAGIACTAVNVWLYNMYVNVTDEGVVYSTERSLEPVELKYDDFKYLVIVKQGGGEDPEAGVHTLWVMVTEKEYFGTNNFLLHKVNILADIDKLIRAFEEVSGKYIDVFILNKDVPGREAWRHLDDQQNNDGGK